MSFGCWSYWSYEEDMIVLMIGHVFWKHDPCHNVCVNMYFRPFTQWSSSRDSEFRNQMIPSIRAPGSAGILFPRIAALPRCSNIPILLQIWETASPSSSPVWRANAAPSFFTSLPASGCHPLAEISNTSFWVMDQRFFHLPSIEIDMNLYDRLPSYLNNLLKFHHNSYNS